MRRGAALDHRVLFQRRVVDPGGMWARPRGEGRRFLASLDARESSTGNVSEDLGNLAFPDRALWSPFEKPPSVGRTTAGVLDEEVVAHSLVVFLSQGEHLGRAITGSGRWKRTPVRAREALARLLTGSREKFAEQQDAGPMHQEDRDAEARPSSAPRRGIGVSLPPSTMLARSGARPAAREELARHLMSSTASAAPR